MKEISGADFMPIDGAMAQILSVVNGLSCVFGSVGNFALIAVILLHKQLHGASEILLMSLAFADFVSCAVYLPLLLMRINTNEKLPTVMNQSRRAIGQAVVVCGSLNLLMLTVDRLVFFYRPLRYARWMRKKIITTIIIIIYGISLFVGFYAYFEMIKSQYPKVALVGVPMLAFFMLHYAIYRLAQAHRNRVVNQEQSLQHNYNINSGVMVQARRNVRTVMLFGILYLMTWLPVTIFQLRRSVTNYHDPESFQKYFYLLLTIQQISASIDPYLCCYRNNKVKAVFKKLIRIRKYLKVSALGSSPCITTSLSVSDGLDTGKGNRKLSAVSKAAVVSQSLENMLEAKVLGQLDGDALTNSGDNLDRIISIASSLERASPNEYESFGNIYKIKSLERTITRDDDLDRIIGISSAECATPIEYENFANMCKIRSYSIDSNVSKNMDQFTVDQSTLEESALNLAERLDNVNKIEDLKQSNTVDLENIADVSFTESPPLDVSEHLENTHSSEVIHSDSEKKTDICTTDDIRTDTCTTNDIRLKSGLSEFERLQNMNNDIGQNVRVENVEEMESLTSDEVVSNLNKTKEFSDMEQSEEKELLEQPFEQYSEQFLGLEQSLEQSSELEQSLERSIELKQPLEQSLKLEQSVKQCVALEKCRESQMSCGEKNLSLANKTVDEQSIVLNITTSVDDYETTTKL